MKENAGCQGKEKIYIPTNNRFHFLLGKKVVLSKI